MILLRAVMRRGPILLIIFYENVILVTSLLQQNFRNSIDLHPSYLVLAPKIVRPGNVYRVLFSTYQMQNPVHVRTSISRDGVELTSAKEYMKQHETQTLQMLMPEGTIPGKYVLRIEGNTNGALGGSVFSAVQELEYLSKFLTIMIQTNRAVYNADQFVRFRVIILTTDMKPYTEAIDINMVSPKGYTMKNYGSVYLNLGVGSFEYKMPLDPNRGWWTIQVVARGQVEEKKILVEKYYYHRTEVFMQMPEAVLDTDEEITGVANGWYLNSAPVIGNGTLKVFVITPSYHYKQSESILLTEEEVLQFEGAHEFTVSLSDIEKHVTSLPGCTVLAEFNLYDKQMDLHAKGYIKTRIVDGNVLVRFIEKGPMYFKPGMPFKTYVAVSHGDLSKLSAERIKESTLRIVRTATEINGRLMVLPDITGQITEKGIFKLEFIMPNNIIKVTMKAVYSDSEEIANAEMLAFPYYSNDIRRLHIYTSTTTATVGEYVVLHLEGNFYFNQFNFVIISKGLMVHSGTEEVESNLRKPIKTFTIALSSEMTPSITVVVYHVTLDGILVSDSLTIPVVLSKKNEFTFELNNRKDKTGNTLEFRLAALDGNFLAVSGQDIDTSCINCGQELSTSSVLETLHSFNDVERRPSKIIWSSRDVNPDQIDYFDSPNKGMDEKDTFQKAGLLLFTDAVVSSHENVCGNYSFQMPCLDGTCITTDKRCNKQFNCRNGYDEINCTRNVKDDSNFDMFKFRIFRSNRFDQFYDMADGDWAWFDLNSNGFDATNRIVPNRASSWIFTAFEVSRERGISIVDQPLQYVGTKPFFISAELPPICRRGEQLGVRVEVFNFLDHEVYALVVLKDSKDYNFIHVEDGGYVKSYDPRTSTGEHHHLIWVTPGKSVPVYYPIVLLTVGEVTVTVEAWTHVAKDVADITIDVLPEGVTQVAHTSLMLDLKNQPISVKFLDINVTETPIVPYERWRRYVFGSPLGYVSLVGDTFGPTFTDGVINAEKTLQKPDRTGEMQLYNFAANLWTLKYLRLTNQLTPDVAGPAFDELNYYYAYIMAYQHERGYFTMFRDIEGSVWLTALIIRIFHETNFPDWENDIFIDPQIMVDAMSWLLEWQTLEGSFLEPFTFPLDRKLNPQTQPGVYSMHQRNISLTAQVLLTLCEVNDLPGDLRTKMSNAKLHATHYLERHLSDITDPYEIAIVTYALTTANSADKDAAFNKLDAIKYEQEGHVYWSKERRSTVPIVMENQRPYIQPNFPSDDDAVSVETTAYALLVYVLTENTVQEQIVRWINTMRATDGGFISTRDSIVAMEALTEYSFRARIRDITDMTVRIQESANPTEQRKWNIGEENLSQLQRIQLDNVWGHIDVQAQGSGFAIIQMDVQYGVDYQFLIIPPPKPAFDIDISMRYSGKNHSRILVKSCQRWTLLDESPVSGLAVVEIQTPTGYYIQQEELNEYVFSKTVPSLRRAKISYHSAVFYFDHLDSRMSCVNFRFNRYFPAANMTQNMKAKIYEYYAPERYNERLFEVLNLYSLDICQVCGSYQCPYCPYFNVARLTSVNWLIVFIMLILVWNH